MLKNILVASILSLTAVGSAYAATPVVSGDVSIQSEDVYRGQVVSTDPSAGLNLRVDNLLVPGLFVTGGFDTLHLFPTNGPVGFRSDVGAGYGVLIGQNFHLSASVNHVFTPVLYNSAYTEVRGRASYDVKQLWLSDVFVEVGQGVTRSVNTDTYAALGVDARPIAKLTLTAKVSAERYDAANYGGVGGTQFNNAELSANYNLWKGLDAFATYSYGGNYVTGDKIDNQVLGGLQYRF